MNYLYGLLSKYQSDSGYLLDKWTYYAGAAVIHDPKVPGKWWISIVLSRQHYVKRELLENYPKDPFFDLRGAAGVDHKKYFLLDGLDTKHIFPSGDIKISNAIDVGGWGGQCSCGNGRVYWAGDNYDSCKTLACVGGTAGVCKKKRDKKWVGNRIICAEQILEPADRKSQLYSQTLVSRGNKTIGYYGGKCTCPNGEVYDVGAENHECGILACVGGQPGVCEEHQDKSREGVRVICGMKIDQDKKKQFPNLVNELKKDENVGGWGGNCTCPNGETYRVGDNIDMCGSMACVGGTTGVCERMHRDERLHVKAVCAVPTDDDRANKPKSNKDGSGTRKVKKAN
jgi:hypothetical protein